MRPILSREGEQALAALMRGRPLLAFDFDGTLAPLAARPGDARIAPGVTRRLRALARRVPVAIITGRALSDVRERLDFEPRFIAGNHGAEAPWDPAAACVLGRALEPARAHLRARAARLAAAGVSVEDKGASIALHYRLSARPGAARVAIDGVLGELAGTWRVFAGKMVVNLVPAAAPDKADAVQAMLVAVGADGVLFAGDDVNDEPVFERAGSDWLTLRVGTGVPRSAARWFIDHPNAMPRLLDRLLALLPVGATS